VTKSGSSFPGLETSNVAVCSASLHSLRETDELPKGKGLFWKTLVVVVSDFSDLHPAATAMPTARTLRSNLLLSGLGGDAGSGFGIAGFIASSPELKKIK
jgi:hypothetical protein